MVYLTRWGDKPLEYSINKELREKLESENKILCLSHNDMGEWIEEHILKNKNYEFLKDEEYQSIYSALIQIKDNEKTISKTSEESKMEKQEIKNFFEDNKYFDLLLKGANDSDTKKIEELNKSIKFFEDVNEAIKEKKSDIILSIESVKEGIKYSLDVANYLKNKGVNIWSKKDGNIWSSGGINEEQLRKNMSNECYSYFFIPIIDKWKLQVYLDQRISDLGVGIFSDNVNIIKKLSDEAIKNEIEKILENCKYVEEDGYSYTQYICITEEVYPTAEETANKMIALYDLLNKLKDKIIQ